MTIFRFWISNLSQIFVLHVDDLLWSDSSHGQDRGKLLGPGFCQDLAETRVQILFSLLQSLKKEESSENQKSGLFQNKTIQKYTF